MDAVNLQGVWLNYPYQVFGPRIQSIVGGLHFRYILMQTSIREDQQVRKRDYLRRLLDRTREYQEEKALLEKQLLTQTIYTTLFAEL